MTRSTSGSYCEILMVSILVFFQSTMVNAGSNGAGIRKAILDFGNDGISMHNVVLNLGGTCVNLQDIMGDFGNGSAGV
jgi:hypothetical protein